MKREQLLNRLSAAQFAMWEMHVYLDTHKGNAEAQRLFKKYRMQFEKLKEEYESLYGPLTLASDNISDWLKDPWPWDN